MGVCLGRLQGLVLMLKVAPSRSEPFQFRPEPMVAKGGAHLLTTFLHYYASFELVATCALGMLVSFGYWTLVLGAPVGWPDLVVPALILGGTVVAGSVMRGQYDGFGSRSFASVVWSGLLACLRAFALLVALLFLLRSSEDLSRGAVFCQFLSVTTLVMLGRALFYVWTRRQFACGKLINRRVLVLSDDRRFDEVSAEGGLCDRLRGEGSGVMRIGHWTARAKVALDRAFLDQAVADCRSHEVDTVVIMPASDTFGEVDRIIAALSETPVTIHVLPLTHGREATLGATSMAGMPSVVFSNSPISRLNKVAKRSLDVAVSGLMLFLLSPLFVSIGVAIRLESRGPVFFRQTRHGYGSRPFRVFKFRSMRVLEDGAAFRQATRNDSRITAVGRFLRRSNLDELPQLLNVLFGDMSLVGPRPHPVALNESFSSRIMLFHRRHNIPPGITGWAQVNGFRGETDTHEKMAGRIEHDLWYIDNWSLGLDLRIMILTLFSSVAYRNAG